MIIGLSGAAGAGKSVVAKMLCKYNMVEIAFADPIKRAAMNWWDFQEDQLWGPSEMRNKPDKRYPLQAKRIENVERMYREGKVTKSYRDAEVKNQPYLTPRLALQQIGTEIARSLDENVWIRYGLKVARQLLQRPSELNYKRTIGVVEEMRERPIAGVVLSDVRFANELLYIGEEGGKLIRIKRHGAGLAGEAAKHASETEQQAWTDDRFDYVLDNDGTLVDLQDKVDLMVETFGVPLDTGSKQLELF